MFFIPGTQEARMPIFFLNDKNKVVVVSVEGFPFYLRASKQEPKTYFQVVTLEPSRTCNRVSEKRQAKTKLLAKKFMGILRHTPNIKVNR